ncbi:MAG TPA: PAS domain-containing protein, partial [Methanoregulaceae archaeon]|nr:PAS domain-containing protein [Methanoregulaceae archaeon]
GQVIAPDFVLLHYPHYWHYDFLFGLMVLSEAGMILDERCKEALDLLEAVTKGTNVIIAAQDRDFHYSYFNKAYADVVKEITGKDLFLGMSMFDLFSDMPDELANNIRQWRRVMFGESINARAEFPGPYSSRRTYNILHTPLLNAEGMVVGA